MKIIEKLFDGVDGIEIFIDDIIIWVETLEEHYARLEKVLNVCERNNLEY